MPQAPQFGFALMMPFIAAGRWRCNKWLRWAFVEAAWVAIGCDSYFGDSYKKKRALGKKANSAILCVARRMARIT